MSEVKIEHRDRVGEQEAAYILTPETKNKWLLFEGDADYVAVKQLQDTVIGKDAEIEKLTADVEALWQTIDDMDTGLDMFKPPLNAFAQYIIRKVKERFKIRSSDGYVLLPPDTSTKVET